MWWERASKDKKAPESAYINKMEKAILDGFLWMKADEKVREMKAAGERILCIWDVSEPPYSEPSTALRP